MPHEGTLTAQATRAVPVVRSSAFVDLLTDRSLFLQRWKRAGDKVTVPELHASFPGLSSSSLVRVLDSLVRRGLADWSSSREGISPVGGRAARMEGGCLSLLASCAAQPRATAGVLSVRERVRKQTDESMIQNRSAFSAVTRDDLSTSPQRGV